MCRPKYSIDFAAELREALAAQVGDGGGFFACCDALQFQC
jgi:hypothetical protein